MRIVVEIVQVLRRESDLVTSDSELGEEDEDEDDDEEHEDEEGEDEEEGDEAMDGQKGRKSGKKGKKGKQVVEKGPQDAERRKELDLRCLAVVKALLERVMSVRCRPS